ncbi:MAG: DUF2470 domain-containing protein [Pseudomonadota bacterium]
MSDLGNEARRFVRGQQNGVLATLSQRLPGYPFGSVAPFVLDQQGRPVILISSLAEHTRNIGADPRVSLIVQPFSPDMQEAGRVTLVGRAERLPDKDALGPRYLRYLPQAAAYFALHDFAFYRIEPERIRYIGGFGKIHWIEAAAYLAPAYALAEAEAGILEHMNRDHADALLDYCRHFQGVTPQAVEMIGIDGDGFDLRADGRILRFDFSEPIVDAAGARQALVEMVQRCRL